MRACSDQYDALNRLTGLETQSAEGVLLSKASYRYDAFNRRIDKSVTHYNEGAANTETTEFQWLGTQLVAEYEQGSATPTKRYRYANGFAPISYSEGDQHYSVHSDHLQTPQVLTDSQGNTAWQAELSPYGLLYSTSETISSANQNLQFNLRFPGQYHDRESGLYYNLNRYYDPEQGRYVTSDPIGLAGGVNAYGYVEGNPVNAVDPLGLDIMVIGGGRRAGSYNFFGHVGSAVTGHGTFSYGNDTPLGSSVTDYLQSQSHFRNQTVVIIPATPDQDAAAAAYFSQKHPDPNGVGYLDNCAVRVNEGLMVAGFASQEYPFPWRADA